MPNWSWVDPGFSKGVGCVCLTCAVAEEPIVQTLIQCPALVLKVYSNMPKPKINYTQELNYIAFRLKTWDK